MNRGVLYVSYDEMLEPLGQSQVIAYLERLAGERCIHLLSFEKPEDWADHDRRERAPSRLRAAGIHWHPRRYHKRPSASATACDIGIGTLWLYLLILLLPLAMSFQTPRTGRRLVGLAGNKLGKLGYWRGH